MMLPLRIGEAIVGVIINQVHLCASSSYASALAIDAGRPVKCSQDYETCAFGTSIGHL